MAIDLEAVQVVVERVCVTRDGTRAVRDDLEEALGAAGITLLPESVLALARAIDERGEAVSVDEVIGEAPLGG